MHVMNAKKSSENTAIFKLNITWNISSSAETYYQISSRHILEYYNVNINLI